MFQEVFDKNKILTSMAGLGRGSIAPTKILRRRGSFQRILSWLGNVMASGPRLAGVVLQR